MYIRTCIHTHIYTYMHMYIRTHIVRMYMYAIIYIEIMHVRMLHMYRCTVRTVLYYLIVVSLFQQH